MSAANTNRSGFKLSRYKREASAALAYLLLLLAVGIIAPTFFSAGNLRDLALNNAATLIVAVGMTLVILVGQIDISIGSQFAVCSVAAGLLATTGMPVFLLFPSVLLIRRIAGLAAGLVATGTVPADGVTARAKLLEARQQLANLVRYMDGKMAAEESLRKLLADPQLMAALKDRASESSGEG